MICLICSKNFEHLGSHLWHKHKIFARDYKREHGLDLNYPLISENVRKKKQRAFWEHPNCKEFLKNLKKNGSKNYFKKGNINRDYFSRQTLDRAMENLEKINSREAVICPICGVKTKNIGSHLFMAHGLLDVNKKKDKLIKELKQ